MPRLRLDLIVLIVPLVAVLGLARGHGLWGWGLGLVAAALGGAVVALLGRRFQWSHGHPRKRERPGRS
jgi:hypothetical protein